MNCVTEIQLQNSIYNMRDRLYPLISSEMDAVSAELYNSDHINDEKLMMDIKAEFRSVRLFDDKLVFPAIDSLLPSQKAAQSRFNPNIQELIRLSQNKDLRLFQLLEEIEDGDAFIKQQMQPVRRLFFDKYFPERSKWFSLLNDFFIHTKENMLCKTVKNKKPGANIY